MAIKRIGLGERVPQGDSDNIPEGTMALASLPTSSDDMILFISKTLARAPPNKKNGKSR